MWVNAACFVLFKDIERELIGMMFRDSTRKITGTRKFVVHCVDNLRMASVGCINHFFVNVNYLCAIMMTAIVSQLIGR